MYDDVCIIAFENSQMHKHCKYLATSDPDVFLPHRSTIAAANSKPLCEMPSTSKTITAHLLSLLPSFTAATLPASLVDLTSSLCAKSRARASGLTGEEELAREYICAYMAIER